MDIDKNIHEAPKNKGRKKVAIKTNWKKNVAKNAR